MAKKKKKKSIPTQQLGGYKRFVRDLHEALSLITTADKFVGMASEFKRTMYAHTIGIRNPVAANNFISPKELKLITKKTKFYYREKTLKHASAYISTYQMHLIYCHTKVMSIVVKKEKGNKDHPEVLQFNQLANGLFTTFHSRYLVEYFRMIIQMSNPLVKYYGVNIRTAAIFPKNPKLELVTEIFGMPARKSMITINGNNRPIFQLAKPEGVEPIVWINVDKSVLGSFYEGNKQVLPVYIQSHALKRIKERLDLLDQPAINYALWDNTHTIDKFEFYKDFLLLPFKIFDVKIGYLVANVINDKVIFRTFLFITHNSTPEGDLLKKISGLGKYDISYWKIDRLSTFVNVQVDKHPELIQLFSEAGLKDLTQLKNQDFDVDTMQAANMAGLSDYIKRGQKADQVQINELNQLLNPVE